jgi:hypothetical protein
MIDRGPDSSDDSGAVNIPDAAELADVVGDHRATTTSRTSRREQRHDDVAGDRSRIDALRTIPTSRARGPRPSAVSASSATRPRAATRAGARRRRHPARARAGLPVMSPELRTVGLDGEPRTVGLGVGFGEPSTVGLGEPRTVGLGVGLGEPRTVGLGEPRTVGLGEPRTVGL